MWLWCVGWGVWGVCEGCVVCVCVCVCEVCEVCVCEVCEVCVCEVCVQQNGQVQVPILVCDAMYAGMYTHMPASTHMHMYTYTQTHRHAHTDTHTHKNRHI